MRSADVFVHGRKAGELRELKFSRHYIFEYTDGYSGPPVSLTMPVEHKIWEYDSFPPFFEGLLPEGYQLEGLLSLGKIDQNDFFYQLVAVGNDLVGNVTVKGIDL